MHKMLCILATALIVGACSPSPESTTVNFSGTEKLESSGKAEGTNEVNFSSTQNNKNIKVINVQNCSNSVYSGTAVDKKVAELVNSGQYDIVSIKTVYGKRCASAMIFHKVK